MTTNLENRVALEAKAKDMLAHLDSKIWGIIFVPGYATKFVSDVRKIQREFRKEIGKEGMLPLKFLYGAVGLDIIKLGAYAFGIYEMVK